MLAPVQRPAPASSPPVGAIKMIDTHFKGQKGLSSQLVLPRGIMPVGTFLVCGECTDEGGGSSGQCACH